MRKGSHKPTNNKEESKRERKKWIVPKRKLI
jgi:hypothetical protein